MNLTFEPDIESVKMTTQC